MAQPRLVSLAFKAQLSLGALLLMSLCALLYFHWQERSRQLEAEQTQLKLDLSHQLNSNLNNRFQEQTQLLQQWASQLSAKDARDLPAALQRAWSLLAAAGPFNDLQLYERNGQPLLKPGPNWPASVSSNWINTVYRSDSPHSLLACAETCSQFVGIPLRLPQQPVRILVAESKLTHLTQQLMGRDNLSGYLLASDSRDNWLRAYPILGAAAPHKIDDLLQELSASRARFAMARYQYKVLPIFNNRDLSWLLITDRRPIIEQRYGLLKLQVTIAVLAIIATLCVSWLFSRMHLRRLFRQIHTLRLVADQQFDAARERLPSKPSLRIDELDLLADVTADLTFQAEASARSADSRSREMERLALYDPLTNLPNRNLFVYEVEQLLNNGDFQKAALLVIDVDKFQRINDSLGHQGGDQLLTKVAERIRAGTGSKDFCARLSGNNFGVLLMNLNPADLKIRVNKITDIIRQPLIVKQQKLMMTASMGLCTLEAGHPATEQLRNAEIAMYRAKQQGGNRCLTFSPEFKSLSRSKVSLEAEIHRALEQKEFRLYLQSKVDMSATIRGFEALCRWDHPDRGILSPSEFVPVMADLGLQPQLDKWMLEASCRQLKTWQQLYPDIRISVNVTTDHFVDPGFLTFLQQTINRYGVRPGQLELEITETLLMDNLNLALQTIDKVKALGVSIAIDDFGTGYSSLSYLKNLPVDTLKIDREFIKDIPFDESDMHISAVIIFLARQLGFTVVAEGVETSEQLVFLKANHCDLAQGYLFSQPIPAHKAMIMMESQRGVSSASPKGMAY